MADRKIMITIGADGKAALAEIDGVGRSVKGLGTDAEVAAGKSRLLNASMAGMASSMALLPGIIATLGIGATAKELVEAAVAGDKMRNAMTAATGSSTQGAAELQFIRIEAQRLGLDLLSSADAFVKLAAAAKGTKLEGQGARDIFTAVSEASTTLGLSAENSAGALYAIQQMISKGTVASEELRGQLGERLPGAFNVAARAMGVSTAELGKMLEGGKVVADEFLPKFATELVKTFGASETATHSAQAEINRFNTAIFEMKQAIVDQGGADSLKTLASWGTSAVGVFRNLVFEVSDAKMRIQDMLHRMKALDEGSWFTKDGRAEKQAALAAMDEMFAWQEQKLEERRNRSMSVPGAAPPGPTSPPGGGAGDNKKKKGQASSTPQSFFNDAWNKAADELAYEDALAFVLKVNDLGNNLKFSDGGGFSLFGKGEGVLVPGSGEALQKETLAREEALLHWAVVRKESDQLELQDTREFLALKASLSDGGHQQELFRISQEEAAWVQSYAMNTSSFEIYEQRKAEIAGYYSKKQEELARRELIVRLGYNQQMFSNMASAADIFYNLSGKKNRAAFKAMQLMKYGETVVSTASGIMLALSDGSSYSYYERAAKAASVGLMGIAQLASIRSASDTGGGSISSPAAGGGSSPPSSPAGSSTPTSSDTTTQAAPVINIHVYGINYGLDHDKLARDIYPSIRRAISDGVH